MLKLDATPASHSLTAPKPMPTTPTPKNPTARNPGAWRYQSNDRPWLMLVIGLIASASFHVVLLYGFNGPRKVIRAAPVEEVAVVQIAMPDLKEEEPETVQELGEVADETPAMAVPMLADAPSVTVSAFVQPLQYAPDVTSNLQAAKVTQIPVNIARGGRTMQNLGKVFEISQLDRQPSPIAQPAPNFPFQMKQQYTQATVIVEFIVTENGDVVNATAQPSVHRDFEDAAIMGVSKWKFRPGMKSGKRVNTRVRIPINFTVQDEE
jgi:protein TonB